MKNFSVPKLNVSGLHTLTPTRTSGLKSPHVESSKNPLVSQLANLNRSSSLNHDSSVARQAMGLSEQLNAKMEENDRYERKTPFMVQSNYISQPKHMSSILAMPPQPKDSNVLPDEYNAVYNNIIRKYKRRNRFGKLLTMDPMEFNKLTEQGYKLKAERYMFKRERKRKLKRQRSEMTGEPANVRGDPDYKSSTESSATSRSSVSYGGVPEADLEHVDDDVKKNEINDRRNMRRASKW